MAENSGGDDPPIPNNDLTFPGQIYTEAMEVINNSEFQYEENYQQQEQTQSNNNVNTQNTGTIKRPSQFPIPNGGVKKPNPGVPKDNPNPGVPKANPNPGVPKDNPNPKNPPVSQDKNENKKSSYELNKDFRFNQTDKGPYFVIIESENKNLGKLHKMSVGKIMFNHLKNEGHAIENVDIAGRNRIKVVFSNFQIANKILDDREFLSKNDFQAYIPESLVLRRGVIRNVDVDLTVEEINEVIKSSVKITNIRRMSRKTVENDKTFYSNTGTVVLTFRGQILPETVSIYGARCVVTPYIYKVVQCHNCYRFGHLSNQCRSASRCINCGDNHNSNDCKAAVKCISCKEQHKATDPQCPEFVNQRSIKKYMAFHNVGYKEAKLKYRNFSEVVSNSTQDFPSLPLLNRYQALDNQDNELQLADCNNSSLLFSNPRRRQVFRKNFQSVVDNSKKVNSDSPNRPSNNVVTNEAPSTSQAPSTSRSPIINPYRPQPYLRTNINSSNTGNNFNDGFLNKLVSVVLKLMSQASEGLPSDVEHIKNFISTSLQLNSQDGSF